MFLPPNTCRYCFHDVLSTDQWARDMVPAPVAAILLCFPITKASNDHATAQQAAIEADPSSNEVDESIFFMEQHVGNACGTIGLLHAVGNSKGKVEYPEDSWLGRFYPQAKGLDGKALGEMLEQDEEIEEAHVEASVAVEEGQPEVQHDVDDSRANLHFIAFVEVKGRLYELDGCKSQPINHVATTADTFFADTCGVIQGFMARDPENMNFNIVALGPAEHAADEGGGGNGGNEGGENDDDLANMLALSMLQQ